MSHSRKKRLSQQDLRALATPGLMARRVGSDGRARLEMLATEGPGRRQQFARRLTDDPKPSERSNTA